MIRQTLIALATPIILTAGASFAAAANQDMNAYTGSYSVKDCAYSENYVNYPKDYNCRFNEIRVTAQANNTFEISYTDELNQKVDDIGMTEFKEVQKDGSTIAGVFAYTDTNVTWTYTKAAADGTVNYTDTRTFTLNADGSVAYDHNISAAGDSYKTADWNYSLSKEK